MELYRRKNQKSTELNLKIKKLYIMALAFSMVFAVGIISNITSVSTVYASTKNSSKNKKAHKAYKKVLEKSDYKYDAKVCKFQFALYDVNKDGVDELLIASNGSDMAHLYYDIYTYYNGKAKLLNSFERVYPTIYKDGTISYLMGHMGSNNEMFYKIKKGKLKVIAGLKGYDYYSAVEGKKNVQIEKNEYFTYYWYYCKVNGKNVKLAALRKWEKSFLKSGKKVKLQYYNNKSKNRNKYLK